ncbi:MAG TPA: potassium channel family protein [Alphaproteobacteria bacterium]|nr:potassium channel family protein [Alphaproteobacteria bacterium]
MLMADLIGWFAATLLVAFTIAIHFESMRLVSDSILPWALKWAPDRRAIVIMLLALMLAHIVEIWLYALTMMIMAHFPDMGRLEGDFDGRLTSYLYFSASNYTSVGYGDIHPKGFMRSISVSEALTGLLMIAWSASMTYLKMEQIWNKKREKKG